MCALSFSFFLDGILLFSSLPTGNTDTSQYQLTFISSTQTYALLLKTHLTQGDHTWKIRAADNNGNTAAPDTWNFSIIQPSPVPGSGGGSASPSFIPSRERLGYEFCTSTPTAFRMGYFPGIVDCWGQCKC